MTLSIASGESLSPGNSFSALRNRAEAGQGQDSDASGRPALPQRNPVALTQTNKNPTSMSNTKHSTCLKTGTLFAGVLVAGLSGATAQNATAPAPAPAPAATVPAAEVKKPFWEVSAALGATITSGNSDSVMVTAGILAQHKDLKNEIRLSLDGGYGKTKSTGPLGVSNNQLNAQFVRGTAQYNRLITERFYFYGRVDGLYDAVAGVDYRFTISPGAGYYFIKTDKLLLSGEVGPGVVTERLNPTRGASAGNDTYCTIRFGETFEYKLSDKTRIWQNFEYLPNVADWGQYVMNFTVGIETSLTKKLSLRSFLQDSYQSQPATGRVHNDLKWITGIAYKF